MLQYTSSEYQTFGLYTKETQLSANVGMFQITTDLLHQQFLRIMLTILRLGFGGFCVNFMHSTNLLTYLFANIIESG